MVKVTVELTGEKGESWTLFITRTHPKEWLPTGAGVGTYEVQAFYRGYPMRQATVEKFTRNRGVLALIAEAIQMLGEG